MSSAAHCGEPEAAPQVQPHPTAQGEGVQQCQVSGRLHAGIELQ